jgi:hypothetical protein
MAVGTPYLNPAPPGFQAPEIIEILKVIPPMRALGSNGGNDRQLTQWIGERAVSLLRWVLLSNRSHLITLEGNLQLPDFPNCVQFMALLSSPESEEVFNTLKSSYGSFLLWHGSKGERWHPIIRNGLKNLTGTPDQANGSVWGEGIYFAKNSRSSLTYSKPAVNNYVNSELGKELQIISLCEVAAIPDSDVRIRLPLRPGERQNRMVEGHLNRHNWVFTLTMEQACIVRFVFVGCKIERDVVEYPLEWVPTIGDVLAFQAQLAQ